MQAGGSAEAGEAASAELGRWREASKDMCRQRSGIPRAKDRNSQDGDTMLKPVVHTNITVSYVDLDFDFSRSCESDGNSQESWLKPAIDCSKHDRGSNG